MMALLLVLLLSIESFGAVVSDNDGSAFITKAEFDSLKNSFQAQIDQYNTSIDSKIDGAIASYLAGIRMSKREIVIDKFDSTELTTGQLMKNIKWSNATNYNVNPCNRLSGTQDYQTMWQKGSIYLAGTNQANNSGIRTIITINKGTAANTRETRIELDQFGRICAWGDYSIGFELVNNQTKLYNGVFNDCGAWIPINFDEFCRSVRRPWLWYPVANTLGYNRDIAEETNSKCFEVMPSSQTSFTMSDICIAPLSITKEACIYPQPNVNDTSAFTGVSGTSTTYGERVIYYNSTVFLNTDVLRNAWNVQQDSSVSGYRACAYANIAPRPFDGLEARYFRPITYNELTFSSIYIAFGINCPMKCGMPMTTPMALNDGDKVEVTVKNAVSDGYMIPYLSKNPDATWDGKKTSYQIDKYRITAGGNSKKIVVDVDEKQEYTLFVVWLPSTPCVLPDLDIVKEASTTT